MSSTRHETMPHDVNELGMKWIGFEPRRGQGNKGKEKGLDMGMSMLIHAALYTKRHIAAYVLQDHELL